MEEALAFLRQCIVTAPQPVALALGQVCRHDGNAQLVESCLKAGEVLARYLAALSISSFCAREDAACPVLLPEAAFTSATQRSRPTI